MKGSHFLGLDFARASFGRQSLVRLRPSYVRPGLVKQSCLEVKLARLITSASMSNNLMGNPVKTLEHPLLKIGAEPLIFPDKKPPRIRHKRSLEAEKHERRKRKRLEK